MARWRCLSPLPDTGILLTDEHNIPDLIRPQYLCSDGPEPMEHFISWMTISVLADRDNSDLGPHAREPRIACRILRSMMRDFKHLCRLDIRKYGLLMRQVSGQQETRLSVFQACHDTPFVRFLQISGRPARWKKHGELGTSREHQPRPSTQNRPIRLR